MKIIPHLVLVGLMLASANVATAQEDLLWKAENNTSTTLVPLYQGWGTTFKIPSAKSTPAVNDKQKEADVNAARAALLAAQREALARQQEANAKKKAAALLASPGAIGADMQNVRVEGIMQGPAGSSMLLGGHWLQQGSQLLVSSTVSKFTLKAVSGLQGSDSMAATLANDGLQARLAKQPSISVTLVQVTSASAIFSDGHQRYTVPASQSAF
jgi:hypothetical protein